MMKKLLAMMLAALMLVSVVACTPAGNTDDTTAAPNNTDDTTAAPGGENTDVPTADKTLGDYFIENFTEIKTEKPTAPAEEIIYAILDGKIGMALMSMGLNLGAIPVEPGLLTGFGTESAPFEVTGFTTGACFLPMIGSVPFIGYVFDVADEATAKTFAETLKKNANPRWNICTEAETVNVAAVGNSVLVVMCQKEAPGALTGKAAIVEPTVEAGSAAAAAWEGFKTAMESMKDVPAPMLIAEDIAKALAANGFAGEVAPVMDVIKNDFFAYEIDSYNAATITASNGSVAYIFVLDSGMDVNGWADYYATAKDGVKIVWGAYNQTILMLVNA